MKKVITLALVLVMVMMLSVSAFAAGGFVSSPSKNDTPVLENVTSSDPNWTGSLVVVPYAERGELNSADKAELEAAYAEIAANKDLGELVASLGKDMAVSDLFYIDEVTNARAMRAVKNYKITLSSKTLDNFEALLNYSNGEWTIVEGAKVNAEGDLEFTTEKLGVFAVVIDTDPGSNVPDFGDVFPLIAVAVLMVAAACVVVFMLKNRKSA